MDSIRIRFTPVECPTKHPVYFLDPHMLRRNKAFNRKVQRYGCSFCNLKGPLSTLQSTKGRRQSCFGLPLLDGEGSKRLAGAGLASH